MNPMTRSRPSLLAVDDEERARDAFRRELDPLFDVRCASGGREALAFLSDHAVDVVLSDFRMPDLDGLHLLEIVAQRRPGIRRILITAYADLDLAIDAFRSRNVHRLLRKPWNREDLRSTLEREAGLPLAGSTGPLLLLQEDWKQAVVWKHLAEEDGFSVFPVYDAKNLTDWIDLLHPGGIITPLYSQKGDAIDVLRIAQGPPEIPVLIIAPDAIGVTLTQIRHGWESFLRRSVTFLVEPFERGEFLAAVRTRFGVPACS